MRLVRLFLALLFVGAWNLFALSPAQATSTHYTSFQHTAYWKNKAFGCAVVTMSGKLGTQRRFWYDPYTQTSHYETSGPTVVDPKLSVTIRPVCVGPVANYRSVPKVHMSQGFYVSSCSSSVGVSASYPWGVGVSWTPSCGSIKVLSRATTYTSGYRFVQNNYGTKGSFRQAKQSATAYPKVCVSGDAHVVVYRRTASGENSYAKTVGNGTFCAS
jgi:hypothetical protein